MAEITLLKGKRILLGATGSIACYKAVDLASKLTQAGAKVDVILTASAARFVSSLSFRSITGRPVYDDMWSLAEHVQHVGLAEAADLVVMAPVTANTLAKLAHGLADNLLTVTALAARGPLLLAPAMDGGMYEHPATRANLALLADRGAVIAGPHSGRMASGLEGLGRMVEPAELVGYARLVLGRTGALAGRRVVVTAGPTQEPIDPVRFISNRSTGKQGLALAQAALDAGADVTLIHGPIGEPLPLGAKLVAVRRTHEMGEAVLAAIEGADALFMVAAVADFRPDTTAAQKIKKSETQEAWGRAIGLEPTLDILTAVREQRERTGFPRVSLGFAAETHDAFSYGREKLLRKGLNFIAVNDVLAEGSGFEVDTNRIVLLGANGIVENLPLLTKAEVAERLIQHVAQSLDSMSQS